jgi:hypothetical protein
METPAMEATNGESAARRSLRWRESNGDRRNEQDDSFSEHRYLPEFREHVNPTPKNLLGRPRPAIGGLVSSFAIDPTTRPSKAEKTNNMLAVQIR